MSEVSGSKMTEVGRSSAIVVFECLACAIK